MDTYRPIKRSENRAGQKVYVWHGKSPSLQHEIAGWKPATITHTDVSSNLGAYSPTWFVKLQYPGLKFRRGLREVRHYDVYIKERKKTKKPKKSRGVAKTRKPTSGRRLRL